MVEYINSQDSSLVSVIIPNYNHARYLGDAIQSVLDQLYRHVEIIVVDDGSSDNSREVVDNFGSRIKSIWQRNQGLSAARNAGIQASNGDFIGVLDADDLYDPNYLSTLVPMLEADPGAYGIYCGYRFVDHQNRSLPQIEARDIPDGKLYDALLDGNFLVPESVLVRRQCYEKTNLFDDSLTACEDWDMWLRLSKKYRFIGTDQILTRHRVLPGSMSSDPKKMFNNRLAVLNKHFGERETNGGMSSAQQRAYGRAYLASCVEYQQYGDEEMSYQCFWNMAKVYPDLLTLIDTYYQLGCGDQPKGYMGHFASMDLKRSAITLLNMLDRLFMDPDLSTRLKDYRRTAYSNAYFALALLNYGARQYGETRGLLMSILRTNPRYGLQWQFVAIWLKSLLDVRLVERGTELRQD